MAEGLPTDLLDLILRHYIDCADVPAAKRVCRRWYSVWRARHRRPPPGGGRVCPHGVHTHAIDALVNPSVSPCQLGHVADLLRGGAPLADEWRMELCFLPAVTPSMLQVMVTPELAPAIFSRACEVGAIDVARIALGKHAVPRGNSGMFPLACMLLQRHGHAKDVLDVLLAASTVQWRTLLVWCVQNSLDRVLVHLLPRAVAAAGHVCVLNDAMVEALTTPQAPSLPHAPPPQAGARVGERIAQAIWRQPQFSSQFDAGPYLRRAMDWQWPALMEAAATAAAPANEHFMYAAVHATPAVLQLLLSWFKSTPGSLLGNAAYIAALSAQRVDNAAILLAHVTPMAFARKRADVFFMSALAGQWDLLYALLCAPEARPQGADGRQEARLVERLYRAVLYNGSAAEARRRVLQRLLCMLSQPPPRDLVCKLTQLARECSDIRPAVTRVAMARVV